MSVDHFTDMSDGIPVAELASFESAVEAFGTDLVYTDGPQLVSKADLVGVPFLITAWRENVDATTGRPFTSVEAIVQENNCKVIFNDGSTGVARQLDAIATRTGRRGGVMVGGGLRVSTYGLDAAGVPLPRGSTDRPASMAATYYLS